LVQESLSPKSPKSATDVHQYTVHHATIVNSAFGLTITQYAWMSFVNLLGSLLYPQYSTMFFVESKTLDDLKEELTKQGNDSEFPLKGAVGRITLETQACIDRESNSAYSSALLNR
jgi:hypothetical protein